MNNRLQPNKVDANARAAYLTKDAVRINWGNYSRRDNSAYDNYPGIKIQKYVIFAERSRAK